MVNPRQVVRAIIFTSLLSMLSAASVSLAYGQSPFTVTVSALTPLAGVNPGGTATATIDLGASQGFNSPVSLSCEVTSNQVTDAPQCTVSPESATPPATPALTITTSGGTPAGTYLITVTGTFGTSTETAPLYLNVTELTQDYSLSVLPTTAVPSPVPAGSSATTTVTVMPIGSYSGHQVTLACLSVAPIVTAAPYCSFNPPTVTVAGGVISSTLTITTFGLAATSMGKLSQPRMFYAFWLAVPGLALVGAGASGKHRKLMGILLLVAIAGGLLLLPACNSATVGTTTPNGQVTPPNSYTFTLSAADENGAAPSNVTTCTPPSATCDTATVTLAVTSATSAH